MLKNVSTKVMKNKISLLSFFYFLLIVILLKAIFYESYVLQIVVKLLLFLSLLAIYMIKVPRQQWNKLYLPMIVLTFFGQVLFIKSNSYFAYTFYLYFIAHTLFAIIVYKKYLKDKSFFDAFTFSLPFILTFSIIYIMLEGMEFWWEIRIIVFGFMACLNATIVLLNYIATKNMRNYLLFIGLFIWIVVDGLAAVYIFNSRLEVYYIIIITLDAIVQYIICRGFSLYKDKDGKVVYIQN